MITDLKNTKYKIGDKVILLTKYNEELYGSIYKRIKNKNQIYAYVVGYEIEIYNNNRMVYVINDRLEKYSGDFYLESDLKPYLPYERKLKIKQLNKIK